MADKEISLFYRGRPLVQKNNLDIRYKKINGKKVPFIGHSAKMSAVRDEMSFGFFEQYTYQGFTKPIDYLFEIDLVFYVPRRSEPDLDNLPAIVLDALQGVKAKGTKIRVASTILDDKLLRRESSRKIVEGDVDYDGEPRTEVTIRRYEVPSRDRGDATGVPCDDNGAIC